MSPAQAAQMIGVSRRTIMRAIECRELLAHRDNRNHWRINPADLDAWAAPSGHVHPDMPTPESVENSLRERLSAETARADAAERARDQAEADRDRWQAMAEKLADRPSWWARLWGRR